MERGVKVTGASAASDLLAPTSWPELFARRASRGGDELTAILSLAASSDVITFSGGFPAPETFPVEVLQGLTRTLLTDDSALALQYSPTEGLPAARAAISSLIESRQGVAVDPADVLVTSGGIEALQLLTRTFVETGDRVLVEAPTYLGAIMAFAGFEAEVEGVAIDEGGLCVDELERALTVGPRPKLLYVIPDHQNPSGRTLPLERRRALVETCARHHILLVEDVAYRELAFAGGPQPSLWSMDPETVLQIGTFSKTFFPGVRLGWAVGPRDVVAAMAVAKQNTDQCSGALGQRLVQTALTEGWYHPHVEQARRLYAHRGRLLMEAFDEHLAGVAEWTVPDGGFFSWVRIPGAETRALTVEAMADHVAVVPGAGFVGDRPDQEHVRLSYSRIGDDDLREGVRRLRGVVDRHLADAGRGG